LQLTELKGRSRKERLDTFIEHRESDGYCDRLSGIIRQDRVCHTIGRLRDMLIGYMRVSKADGSQVLDLQRDALAAAGVEPSRLYDELRALFKQELGAERARDLKEQMLAAGLPV
jgi:hypothetical protein